MTSDRDPLRTRRVMKALCAQASGDTCPRVCMTVGMANIGTMTPPMAAAMTTETGPITVACSWVRARLPSRIP